MFSTRRSPTVAPASRGDKRRALVSIAIVMAVYQTAALVTMFFLLASPSTGRGYFPVIMNIWVVLVGVVAWLVGLSTSVAIQLRGGSIRAAVIVVVAALSALLYFGWASGLLYGLPLLGNAIGAIVTGGAVAVPLVLAVKREQSAIANRAAAITLVAVAGVALALPWVVAVLWQS